MRAGHVSRYANKNPGAVGLYERIKFNSVVDRFPVSWRTRLTDALGKLDRTSFDKWRERVGQLVDAERGGIRPDASDADICAQGVTTAGDWRRRIRLMRAALEVGEHYRAWRERFGLRAVDLYLTHWARALMDRRGMLDLWPVGAIVSRAGALRRLECEKWWRRTYRKLHARTVEACAIGLGMVSRAAGLYASDDAVKRRAGQNARNAAALESVTAVNDLGQAQTLAELAAKGTANKAIRRVELLTRIAGFELIAKGLDHHGCMVTMTCPSRFHRKTTREGRVYDNPRYDGSTPAEAQRYLSLAWARFRSAAARVGLDLYGFRIAEPQHDGTPHWHCLLFFRAGAFADLETLTKRYFLDADSPDEPGAQKHRVDFELIDWAKGSAVGYVIKYVSKNIDGHGVGLDLFGNDAITSSARVEAWASTWRIRQFQQIGGAPVGVWRELRRVNADALADDVPAVLKTAISAVNAAKVEPGVQAIAWMRYTAAQGGIGCRRKDMRMRLLKGERSARTAGRAGRYGEAMPAAALGVNVDGVQLFRNHIHEMNPAAPPFQRLHFASVESERCEWFVMPGPRAEVERAAASAFQRSGAAASTRIHVNNCTDRDLSRTSEWAPVRSYTPRLRRFAARPKPPAPVALPESEHARQETCPY